jgi:hypothetical protein
MVFVWLLGRFHVLVDVDYVSAKPVTGEMIGDLARFAPDILRLNFDTLE